MPQEQNKKYYAYTAIRSYMNFFLLNLEQDNFKYKNKTLGAIFKNEHLKTKL